MLGLTPLGVVHTAVSLVALAAGVVALLKHKAIWSRQRSGGVYVIGTFLTAATGLGIFQHGGFGPPHVLALLTLLALGLGATAERTTVFGRGSAAVVAVSYTTTLLFHMIPGFTETLIRLPPGVPLLSNAEAPAFGPIYGSLFVVYLVGLVLQLRWLRRHPSAVPAAPAR